VSSDSSHDATARFYEGLASDYHLVYEDWEGAVDRQAAVLSGLLAGAGVGPPATVWDATCGIGTQALGLASRGYRVTGSDLSSAAIARARQHAARLGLQLDLEVGDVRHHSPGAPGSIQAVISCDNSLPHLTAEDDLLAALGNMATHLAPGGAILISIRDYDAVGESRPRGTVPVRRQTPEGDAIVFQTWEWADDGVTYDVSLFVLRRDGGPWRAAEHAARYRAWRRDELGELLTAAGFEDITWQMPDQSGYFQPVVLAERGRAS
jgi:SAM-dependent methyltransferase